MKTAKALCLIAIVVALIHFVLALRATGPSAGLGLDAFLLGYLSNPWQAVIGIDLMLGLMLASAWIYWREADRAVGLTWIIVMLWWGNLILAIYLYRQLSRRDASWASVFLGQHADSATPDDALVLAAPLRILLMLAAIALAVFAAWGCVSVQFALVPCVGYLSGVGSLSLGAMMMAIRTRPA